MKEILQSKEFEQLVSAKNTVAFTLTALELIVYFGFILLLAFNKQIFSIKIGESMPLGIPLGIGVIVISWILTGVYVYWSNKVYDQKVQEIKKKLGR
ncbi:DUF485 domain-containing protein [Thermocrinis minervae]|uniref:Uncharacterized membrane protein, DUF485 family n=1 Tax=Thermocrinis minervae TaxID=381751 RepID=A0A1M6QC08_9AQUI|nr:DUF485 domain-containing protein [Thermocrinis minervae]SHK17782.1 Uncharacterized membrane protein, DUF485 family [Thermocrinis minervae]